MEKKDNKSIDKTPASGMSKGKIVLYSMAGLALASLLAGLGTFFYLTRDLPSMRSLVDYTPNLITKVYSQDEQTVGEFYIERRIVVSFASIPRHTINAFLAAEDAKFFEHKGVDYRSIMRALYKNILAGRIVQGGSTITQQVARSFFLSPARKISRKIREAVLAYRIEKHLTKEEILHLYLNQIYLGNGAYGVQAASENYFGKDVQELDLAESALLAILPKAPSRYSPYTNPELAKQRQELVLTRMLEEGFTTREVAEEAINRPLKLKPKRTKSMWAGPYFTEHVRRYIEEKYGEDLLYKGGLQVYTTMDVEMQKAANDAVRRGLRAHDKRRGYRGAAVSLKSAEEIEALREETDKKLSKRPLEIGGIYRAVITDVDKKGRRLKVDIGSRKGVIEHRDMAWAGLYNPTTDPDGGKDVKLQTIFNVGDVVEVMVRGLPETESSPIPLKLEQEPLAQAALLAMEPETGYVKAMVGGGDFSKSQFNRAIQAQRQPGSAFKPIIYTAALDSEFTPATIVVDSPLVFEEERQVDVDSEDPEAETETETEEWTWKPRNFGEKFYGPTTIRNALTKSRNVVTIKVLQEIGVGRAIGYARKLGIEAPLTRDLSLALGSSAVSLLEMTRAFGTLAAMGRRAEPIFITRITDRHGNVLEENIPSHKEVLSPQTSYIITNLLKGVVENGTGWRAKALKRPAAGKTGTTNNLNDAWFMGFVPGLVAGTWIGYDEEYPLGRHETGSKAASPIWVGFMKSALEGVPKENFPIPDGVEFAKIDPRTGLLANSSTENPVFEVFKEGTAPTETSELEDQPEAVDFFMIDAGN
ncbi:MAG: PBP1A family penicillin-binding protein [Thermodesulfobacteriota bacterium]